MAIGRVRHPETAGEIRKCGRTTACRRRVTRATDAERQGYYMKRSAQEKFVTLFDTTKKRLLILDHLFAALEKGTRLASNSVQDRGNESTITGLYIWALV